MSYVGAKCSLNGSKKVLLDILTPGTLIVNVWSKQYFLIRDAWTIKRKGKIHARMYEIQDVKNIHKVWTISFTKLISHYSVVSKPDA